ncbi:hypothetical protein B4U80_11222 [Leptotrombidium deliense]|uniref:Uncharacterized protein n=1 Tax=Leptotrombidium deliense TaxID=299467 RepID=A0A443SHT8_9ACAR|nr:hypothetical protein B4U80_11222 [Leptotrombidium deliense]
MWQNVYQKRRVNQTPTNTHRYSSLCV